VAGRSKPTPIDVFEANIADADRLLMLTRVLLNTRQRRMRQELGETVGAAIRVPQKKREVLDCVESDDVFVVLKPDGIARREHFTERELRPLLRQAIVAISAAVESYVAQKAAGYIGEALNAEDRPRRLADMPITLGDNSSTNRCNIGRDSADRRLAPNWGRIRAHSACS
jgi:hypothetical protein